MLHSPKVAACLMGYLARMQTYLSCTMSIFKTTFNEEDHNSIIKTTTGSQFLLSAFRDQRNLNHKVRVHNLEQKKHKS